MLSDLLPKARIHSAHCFTVTAEAEANMNLLSECNAVSSDAAMTLVLLFLQAGSTEISVMLMQKESQTQQAACQEARCRHKLTISTEPYSVNPQSRSVSHGPKLQTQQLTSPRHLNDNLHFGFRVLANQFLR